ncbi:DUF5336 domain-containing protein [Mycolicibacterium thermoresistibile]
MTYPPGSPGYPSAQQPTSQYGGPTQQMTTLPSAGITSAEGPSKLPLYLTAAVAVLGLAIFFSSFADLWTADGMGAAAPTMITGLIDFGIVAGILAGLLAAVALLPKQAVTTGVIAVLSVFAFLMVLYGVIITPEGVSVALGMWLLLAFTLVQAGLAVTVLLFDSGVVAPPVSQPKYDPQQYGGQYGSPYYGQQYGGQPQQVQAQQQRPGYPSQYGGYGASTGGFPAQGGGQSGTPTPPTGFPSYGQPQAQAQQAQAQPGQAQHGQSQAPSTQPPHGGGQAHGGQAQGGQPQSGQSPSSSPQSGQSPS